MGSQSRFSPAIVFLLLTILIDAVGLGIIIPVMPHLIMSIENVDIASTTKIGGYLYITYAAVQFLCGPFFGNISDKFGRRPVILLSLFCFALAYLVMGFATSLVWLFIIRVVEGISGSVYTSAMASIADLTPPEKRAGSFGMVGAAIGLGFIIGPFLGGFLGEFGTRVPFFFAAIMAAANFLFGFFVLHESLPTTKRRPFSFKRANPVGAILALWHLPAVGSLAVILLLWLIVQQVFPATWSYYGIAVFQWTPKKIGLSLAGVGILIALVQGGLAGRLVIWWGDYKTVVIGMLSGFAALICLAFTRTGWMLFIFLSAGALQWAVMPTLNGSLSKMVSPSQQGEIQGIFASLNSLAAIVGPFIMSHTFAFFNDPQKPFHFPGAAFVLAAFITLICLILLVFFSGKHLKTNRI